MFSGTISSLCSRPSPENMPTNMKNPFKKQATPPMKSIAEQAQAERAKQMADKIDKFSDRISGYISREIWEENFEISLYNAIMKAINDKTNNWFNQAVNNQKIQGIVPEPVEETNGDA